VVFPFLIVVIGIPLAALANANTRLRFLFGSKQLRAVTVVSTWYNLVPFADHGWRLWIAALGLLVGGAGVVTYNVAQIILRQRLPPTHLLGRISGGIRLVGTGAVAVGATLAGVLAELIPVRTLLVASRSHRWPRCWW